mmetsp:Transcript_64846/g.200839  ORF Transcript_64846/g.200839 Transcript_64846/m.200839 type:complete len:255 (+) Transcript_64846:331-1095(+)
MLDCFSDLGCTLTDLLLDLLRIRVADVVDCLLQPVRGLGASLLDCVVHLVRGGDVERVHQAMAGLLQLLPLWAGRDGLCGSLQAIVGFVQGLLAEALWGAVLEDVDNLAGVVGDTARLRCVQHLSNMLDGVTHGLQSIGHARLLWLAVRRLGSRGGDLHHGGGHLRLRRGGVPELLAHLLQSVGDLVRRLGVHHLRRDLLGRLLRDRAHDVLRVELRQLVKELGRGIHGRKQEGDRRQRCVPARAHDSTGGSRG